MKKNGKNIGCRTCTKMVYRSESRIGKRHYCSRTCAIQDNYGFKVRVKQCIICSCEFRIEKNIQLQKKTCSYECWKANNYAISKKRTAEKTTSACKDCKQEYTHLLHLNNSGLCAECRFKKSSRERTGRNNPAYRNGLAVTGSRTYTGKHLRACAKYRKHFKERNEYLFCEVCGVNENGAKKFEVHHIYFASLYPKHEHLHDFRNLILLCIRCHNDFHAGDKNKEKFEKLEKERKLKELFRVT